MKKLHLILFKAYFFIAIMAVSLTAISEEHSAISSISNGDWSNTATWSNSQIPGINDDVDITHEVTVSSLQSANSVMVNVGGTLKVEGSTLNIGDDANDALIVDGGILYFGDGSTVNVAGYYKQSYVNDTDKGTMTSATGAGNAYFNISTAGERNSDTDNNYKISSGCVISIDRTEKKFILKTTIENGNSGAADEIYFGTLSTQVPSYIGKTVFVVENGSGLTDLYMEVNSTVIGKFFCDIGLDNTLHVSQTIEARRAKLVFVQISIDSGILELEPGTVIKVGQKVKVLTDGKLILDSDATSSSAGIIYTGDDPEATVRRYIAGNGWHFISPSTSGVVSGDLDQAGSPSVWLTEFVESDIADHWHYIVSYTEPMPLAKGFSVYSEDVPRSDDFIIEYEGDLSSDLITVDLDYSGATQADPDYGLNLVGNPFSASLSFKKADPSLGNNLQQTLWIWDPDHNNGDGTYGRYSFFSWQGGGNHNGVIPVGQGFLVQAVSDNNSWLEMRPDLRVYGYNNWLKSSNGTWDNNHGFGTYAMFKVTNGVSRDEVFISFGENGTTDYENGYDAIKFFGNASAPQLYLKENGESLSINYLESLDNENERVVSMSFDAAISGEYQLMINLDSLPDTKVTLEDLKSGYNHDFENGDYTFSCDKDENPDRFLVHFAYSPTGIGDGNTVSSNVNIYAYNQSVYINNTSNELNLVNSQVFIHDILGREIYNSKVNLNNLVTIPITYRNSYLIVKVVNDGFIKTEKVFVK